MVLWVAIRNVDLRCADLSRTTFVMEVALLLALMAASLLDPQAAMAGHGFPQSVRKLLSLIG